MPSKQKDTVIPMGYRLTVVSWENDADSYNTTVTEGLDRERTQFLIEIAELCRDEKFGNMYEPNDDQLDKLGKALLEIFERYPNQIEIDEAMDREQIALDYFSEFHGDMFGSGGENRYTRVLESWRVDYVPSEIIFKNLSSEFKK